MDVLVIGGGGREHVLAWKIGQSPRVRQVFCAPGNGGISRHARCVDLAATDIEGLKRFAVRQGIGLTVVGPEAPLVEGIVDAFEAEGLRVFGPSRAASRLEGSKVFAKEFMDRHGIPTAAFRVFDDPAAAGSFLEGGRYPLVVKADGLAAGKGVVVCADPEEAREAVDRIMVEKVFGVAGERIVVEEALGGPEASILAISDGTRAVLLDSAQDHKRVFDDDLGPNTGGMGAYSPAGVVTPEVLDEVRERVILPAIAGMKEEGTPFRGVLYAGLMLTGDGPRVLEFNVRFGDPEAQAVLPRLKTDLVDVMLDACAGDLREDACSWDGRAAVCVVMASRGYPGAYERDREIYGVEEAETRGALVFHAGTRRDGDRLLTSGGRVLGVTALGSDIEEAIRRTYEAVEQIRFEGAFYRRDIGARALAKRKAAEAS